MTHGFSRVLFLLVVGGLAAIGYNVMKKRGILFADDRIPLEVFFDNEGQLLTPRISPDGQLLAYRAPVNKVTNIWLRPRDGGDARPITYDTGRGIHQFFWSYDNQHIFYLQDKDGDENWQLYKVNIADQVVTPLTPIKDVQVKVVAYRKEFPNRMLLAINDRDPKMHDVYELSIDTGERTLIEKNSGDIVEWAVGRKTLAIYAALKSIESDGSHQLLIRDQPSAPWKTVQTWSFEDGYPELVSMSADDKKLYLVESGNVDKARLIAMPLATGVKEVIASDDEYDISEPSILFDPSTHSLEAVGFLRERMTWRLIDATLTDDFARMQALDYGDMIVSSRSLDNNFWVIAFTKDNGPIAYWLYDRKEKKGTFLFHHQAKLNGYALAQMKPISFTARDGLKINGYLTCPANGECKNLPLILLVHGGPWARDDWGFDAETQFLASRGYAVLQVNYRGSMGYGKSFLNAGNKEWGGKMQDDLTDAVRWAVDQGVADAKRVAIFGGSYGGYAALAGATFTPDVYRCAVDIVGPSSIITLINSIPPYWTMFLSTFKKRAGDPEVEEEFLKARSPLFHVDKIKIPLLIAQGANDPRVKQAESEQIVAALKEKNIPHEYMLFADEGHGFVRPENKLKFYKKAEEFLAKYLKK